MKRKYPRNRVNLTAMCFAKLVAALKDRGGTTGELARELGIQSMTVRGYILALKREKLIHVGGYGQDKLGRQHPHFKVWKWGNHKDAVFRGLTHEEKKAQQRARHNMKKSVKYHALSRALTGGAEAQAAA